MRFLLTLNFSIVFVFFLSIIYSLFSSCSRLNQLLLHLTLLLLEVMVKEARINNYTNHRLVTDISALIVMLALRTDSLLLVTEKMYTTGCQTPTEIPALSAE